jgi:hypothetical protein
MYVLTLMRCGIGYWLLIVKIQFENRIAFLAEWSKAPDSSSGIVRCVGSNPTECKNTFLLIRFLKKC